jgi:hypothetical protein
MTTATTFTDLVPSILTGCIPTEIGKSEATILTLNVVNTERHLRDLHTGNSKHESKRKAEGMDYQ